MKVNVIAGGLGDSITALPYIQHLYQNRLDTDKSIINCKPMLKTVLPRNDWDISHSEQFSARNPDAHNIDIHEVVSRLGKSAHPTQLIMEYYTGKRPHDVIKPIINIDYTDLYYHYVFAPHSMDQSREIPEPLASRIHEYLKGLGSVFYITQTCGLPLSKVADVMRKAKMVITADSLPNRLAHAAQANHLLLCSDVVPPVWVEYPGLKLMYGAPESWTMDQFEKSFLS